VVHQFGDFGDVSQTSAGSVIAVLANFEAGADGRAEIVQTLNAAIVPSALLGRVVSVMRGAFNTTTNSFGTVTNPGAGTTGAGTTAEQARRATEPSDLNPLTDEGPSPPVTNNPSPPNIGRAVGVPRGGIQGPRVSSSGVVAFGVFGVGSPNRIPQTSGTQNVVPQQPVTPNGTNPPGITPDAALPQRTSP
jgi:hypothetical protein